MSLLPKERFCILVKSWCQLERRISNSQRLHAKQGHCQCNKDDGQQHVWQTSSPVSPGVVKPLHQNGNYLCKNKIGSTHMWGPRQWDICVTKPNQNKLLTNKANQINLACITFSNIEHNSLFDRKAKLYKFSILLDEAVRTSPHTPLKNN